MGSNQGKKIKIDNLVSIFLKKNSNLMMIGALIILVKLCRGPHSGPGVMSRSRPNKGTASRVHKCYCFVVCSYKLNLKKHL